MFTRVDTPYCAIRCVGICRPLSVAALCLSMASFTLAEQHSTRTPHAAPPAHEESVLIATREATPDAPLSESSPGDLVPGTPGEEEVCEVPAPVSQSSDHAPELANEATHDDASTTFDHV